MMAQKLANAKTAAISSRQCLFIVDIRHPPTVICSLIIIALLPAGVLHDTRKIIYKCAKAYGGPPHGSDHKASVA